MNTNTSYTSLARGLHWLIAGLIVGQYVLAKLAEQAEHNDKVVDQLALLANHKSVGMTILGLAIIRLLWRLLNRPPALPDTMPAWQLWASSIVHWLLYGFIFALPLSGWLMSSANAYSVSWFNLFALLDLVGASESLAEVFHKAHHWLAEALFVMAVVHILAALKHHFVDRDRVLGRMATTGGWLIFTVVVALSVGLLGRFFDLPLAEKIPNNKTAASEISVGSAEDQPISDLPIWGIDYEKSFIQFTGDQAGAPFTGQWQRWQALLQIDSERLADSLIDVKIQTDSVFSEDAERDAYIVGSDFFDAGNHDEARFTAREFSKQADGSMTAIGSLTIKGLAHEAAFNFTVTETADGVQLDGKATLDRLTWNIGMGDWADTTWVGQEVTVNVKVVGVIL